MLLLDLLIVGIFLTFACSYITQCLVLEMKSEPFESAEETVKGQIGEDGLIKPVSLFDRFRRLFGVYKVEGNVWFINPLRAPVFLCPFCLSFWVALFLTVPIMLLLAYPVWLAALMVFAVAGATQKVMS